MYKYLYWRWSGVFVNFEHFSSVFIVNFEHVNTGWVTSGVYSHIFS